MTEVLPPRPPSGAGPISVRLAVVDDLAHPAVAGDAGQYRAELSSWMDAMGRGDAAVFVGLAGDELAGRVTLAISDPRRAWISSLMVATAHRRQGVARTLMAAAQDHARHLGFREIRLAVGMDNVAAHALYRDLGYSSAGQRRTQGLRGEDGSWIHHPEDAWEMRLAL